MDDNIIREHDNEVDPVATPKFYLYEQLHTTTGWHTIAITLGLWLVTIAIAIVVTALAWPS